MASQESSTTISTTSIKELFYWLSEYTRVLASIARHVCRHIALMNTVRVFTNTASPCVKPAYCLTPTDITSLFMAQILKEAKCWCRSKKEVKVQFNLLKRMHVSFYFFNLWDNISKWKRGFCFPASLCKHTKWQTSAFYSNKINLEPKWMCSTQKRILFSFSFSQNQSWHRWRHFIWKKRANSSSTAHLGTLWKPGMAKYSLKCKKTKLN